MISHSTEYARGTLRRNYLTLAEWRDTSINHTWKYDVNEFMDGVLEMNTATSFLGSYNTKVDIVDNHDGTYTLNYAISNDTRWESGTRLRVNHDTDDNVHDAIIPDCDRGEGVGLGGTISEVWE